MDSGICLFVKKIFLYRILIKCGKEREIYDPDDSRGFKKAFGFLDEDRGTEEVMRKFRAMLPYLQQLVISDMKAAYEGDPAAKSYEEIIAAYPGPLAILIQRTANCLYKLKVPILPRIMTEYAHSITGIDIHPGAEIGESFFIDHGTGVVIGETAVIGNHVKIYQGVTLGALSTQRRS